MWLPGRKKKTDTSQTGRGIGLIVRGGSFTAHPYRQNEAGVWLGMGPARKTTNIGDLIKIIEELIEASEVVKPNSASDLARILGIGSWRRSYANDIHINGTAGANELNLERYVSDGAARYLVPANVGLSLSRPCQEADLRTAIEELSQITNAPTLNRRNAESTCTN